MRFDEYAELSRRTAPELEYTDAQLNIRCGLIGESGEIVDALKKWRFQSGGKMELPKAKIVEETGDLLWYAAWAARLTRKKVRDEFLHAPNVAGEVTPGCIIACALRLAYQAAETTHSPNDISVEMIVYCCAQLLQLVGSTLEEAMELNVKKLMKRYPDGFDPERSLHRDE